MIKDLTTSDVSRQNILNNSYALEKVELHLALGGKTWKNERIFSKAKVAQLLQVDIRTITRYLEQNREELTKNGYRVLRNLEFKEFKEHVSDINVRDMLKTPSLGIFSFRAVLNLAMIMTESEKAKSIRSKILDIVLDVMAEKSGGHTKYINQREDNYLPSSYKEFTYREEFTNALDHYLDMGKYKYAKYTDKIYQIVFLENAKEYKKILDLKEKDRLRDTLYSEILNIISSIENGIAQEMKNEYEKLGRKLTPTELSELFKKAENNPYLKPIIEDARVKMASRDLCFRDALHEKLESYIQSVPKSDFDKFLGETSKSLEERLSHPDTLAVLKRLKNR
ncbi:MAG: CiaB PROTEIN [uncultured Sulfurovum sp.]|uniref:CiaB PROTEIN n=1 Tax=uncultured Sulfurovum sp. TaxID=269237 RepID=A0A6S6TVL9_9BACT|nr:MAG: CiaB PROTEIN [uncultured Sulfurovum sp.]